MGVGVQQIVKMFLRVLIKQWFHGRTMLGSIENQNEDAQVGGLIHIWLGRVEEWMDLQQLGHERKRQLRMILA